VIIIALAVATVYATSPLSLPTTVPSFRILHFAITHTKDLATASFEQQRRSTGHAALTALSLQKMSALLIQYSAALRGHTQFDS
jgi:hypothetical protein